MFARTSKLSVTRLFTFALGAAALAAGVAAPTDAQARDEANPNAYCYQGSDGFPVCVGSCGGGSTGYAGAGFGGDAFVGAYAHDDGSWSEVYKDDDGSGYWWVTHNNDGSSTIGDTNGGAANYITGPKLLPNVPGSLKAKPAGTGASWVGPKKPLPSTARTGMLVGAGVLSKTIPVPFGRGAGAPQAQLYMIGSGKCDVGIVVSKGGKLVSGFGVKKMWATVSKVPVALPREAGTYRIDLVAEQGCPPRRVSTDVTVTAPIVMQPPTSILVK